MILTRVRKSSLVQDIVNQIENAIVEGTYKPGDKLSSLQKLQKIIGASQGTLREALRILEQKGLIEIRLGIKGGIFIRESSTESITEGLGLLIRQRKISYYEIANFRKVVEAGLIKLVIHNATKEDIDLLKKNLIEMKIFSSKGAEGWQDVLDIEVKIRKFFIKIANDKMYEAVLVPIHENIISYARQLFLTKGFFPQDAYDDWEKTIQAIEKKDVKKTIEITIHHIERYREALSVQTQKNKL